MSSFMGIGWLCSIPLEKIWLFHKTHTHVAVLLKGHGAPSHGFLKQLVRATGQAVVVWEAGKDEPKNISFT